MVVMDIFTRRVIGFGVAPADVDGVSVCRMFNGATAGQALPKHVSTDHDPQSGASISIACFSGTSPTSRGSWLN